MNGRLYGLDLFSGIGGNTLGLRQYIKTIAYCETDRHAQSVLLSRMSDGSIEPAPIWDDVTTLSGDKFDTPIDIIVGGFPCQDISVAGRGAGLAGERSGLFFEIMRLAKEVKPTFLFLENVPAIRTWGLDVVIQELTEAGYDCRWTMLSAANVNAPHKRERWFCLARRRLSDTECQYDQSNARSMEPAQGKGWQQERRDGPDSLGPNVAYSDDTRLEGRDGEVLPKRTSQWITRSGGAYLSGSWWETEPNVGRVVDGCALRVDRLKRLGNGVVPLQAKTAFEILMGLKTKE